MEKNLDVLAFAAHPDDVELSCSGTLLKLKAQGKSVGIVDLTRGELGTRGTADIRDLESLASAQILDLDHRSNLDLGDGFFEESRENLEKVIVAIRSFRPSIIFANALSDRHPDHGRGGSLVRRASFLAGLRRIETISNGFSQEPWRAKALFHYIQFRYIEPDFVVDVTDYFDKKLEAIQAYKSQFYDPSSDEPATMISSKKFLDYISARGREMGAAIEKEFGEGFTTERTLEVKDIFNLI
jgi:bacillithiol biosynthesis deacetylase BshB1